MTAQSNITTRRQSKIKKDMVPFIEESHIARQISDPRLNKVHFLKESLLDEEICEDTAYGISNILIVLLVLTILGDMMSSIFRHGLVIDFARLLMKLTPSLTDINIFLIFIAVSIFLVEIILYCNIVISRNSPWQNVTKMTEYFVLFIIFLMPIVYSIIIHPKQKSILFNPAAYCLILWMKLFSFITVNRWYKLEIENSEVSIERDRIKKGFNHMTRANLYYFIISPTLCYEISFPLNKSIRLRYLIAKFIELFFVLIVILTICQQLFVPGIYHIIKSIQKYDFVSTVNVFIKLSVYINLIWLSLFFLFFHCWLNIIAELTKFGDRMFYSDWWNSTSLEYFWKNWNIPVHRWCKRHIYLPLAESGYSRIQCCSVIFFISAIFHEYLACLILGLIRSPCAFLVMVFQIPAAILIYYIPNARVQNLFIWLGIISSQIIAVVLYSYEYYQVNKTFVVDFGVDLALLNESG